MNSDFQFCCARHLGNSVVVALQELVSSLTPCEQIRRIRVALIMLLICSRHVKCLSQAPHMAVGGPWGPRGASDGTKRSARLRVVLVAAPGGIGHRPGSKAVE